MNPNHLDEHQFLVLNNVLIPNFTKDQQKKYKDELVGYKVPATKYGILGASIGLLIGIITPIPFGIIIGPILGALIGELLFNNDLKKSIEDNGLLINYIIVSLLLSK